MDEADGQRLPDVAYYYPEPYWGMGEVDRLKTLLLFFDGIAILLPRYMRGREVTADPVLAGPLKGAGLLRVLEPETFIDQQTTEELSDVLVEIITSGELDRLDRDVPYRELSRSRLGWNADVDLAQMVVEALEARGLAKPSEDGVSVPLHPQVRTTVLVVLSQLVRRAGLRHGMGLQPITGQRLAARGLVETLSSGGLPSTGHVVALDLETVTVDLASVPLDEVLAFRAEHGEAYRAYARDLRKFVAELGPLPGPGRRDLLLDREEEIADRASNLRRTARRAWWLPLATFALGVVGAAWAATQHDLVNAVLSLAGGTLGGLGRTHATAGAYSYLFEVRESLGSPNERGAVWVP